MEQKLYEITSSMSKIRDVVEDEEQLTKYLDGLDIQLKEKAQGMFSLMKNWDSYSDSIDQEIKRLQDVKKYYKSNVEKMKSYIGMNMTKNNIEKIETALAVFAFRKTPDSVVIDKDVPEEFTVTKTVINPDKIKIKKAIKDGDKVDFAHLESTNKLTIK